MNIDPHLEAEEYDLFLAAQIRKRRASVEPQQHNSSHHKISPRSTRKVRATSTRSFREPSLDADHHSTDLVLHTSNHLKNSRHGQQQHEKQKTPKAVEDCINVLSVSIGDNNNNYDEEDTIVCAMLQMGRDLKEKKNLAWTFCESKGVEYVLQVMKKYGMNARVQVSGLCLLCRIVHANRWFASLIRKAGAVIPTLQAMRHFLHYYQPQVLMNGCALLLKLVDKMKERDIVGDDIVPLVVMIMNQKSSLSQTRNDYINNYDSSSVDPMGNAAKLLWRISATREGRDQIIQAGGAEAISRAMIASSVKKQKQDLMALHLRLLQDHVHAESAFSKIDGPSPSFEQRSSRSSGSNNKKREIQKPLSSSL